MCSHLHPTLATRLRPLPFVVATPQINSSAFVVATPQINYSATAATAAGPSSVPDLDATIAK
jgi:hypothetical protein